MDGKSQMKSHDYAPHEWKENPDVLFGKQNIWQNLLFEKDLAKHFASSLPNLSYGGYRLVSFLVFGEQLFPNREKLFRSLTYNIFLYHS